jgi:hypothetical protein
MAGGMKAWHGLIAKVNLNPACRTSPRREPEELIALAAP